MGHCHTDQSSTNEENLCLHNNKGRKERKLVQRYLGELQRSKSRGVGTFSIERCKSPRCPHVRVAGHTTDRCINISGHALIYNYSQSILSKLCSVLKRPKYYADIFTTFRISLFILCTFLIFTPFVHTTHSCIYMHPIALALTLRI